jgi:hypothetical protein
MILPKSDVHPLGRCFPVIVTTPRENSPRKSGPCLKTKRDAGRKLAADNHTVNPQSAQGLETRMQQAIPLLCWNIGQW